jgi:4-diphosphocytidyl-2-C-methyl-D-erythritol kinase
MRKIRALAPAKVNLTFDITGVRDDGYHQVETLMQAIDLQDELHISVEKSSDFSLDLRCTNEVIPHNFPLDSSNLIVRATKLFLMRAGAGPDFKIDIEIEKNIPIGAGLAGGSSNAAAVLVAMNDLFDEPFDQGQLCTLGKELGADVPFCIVGGTCIGRERGDLLEPINSKLEFSYCLVKPRALSVSTPWAYERFDAFKGDISKPSLDVAVDALTTGDLPGAIASFGNVFEPVIFAEFVDLAPVKEHLLAGGCWTCHLSGSGPALFAIVADREQAHAIRRRTLKTDDLEFDYVRLSTPDLGPPLEFYIAQTLNSGVTLSPLSN